MKKQRTKAILGTAIVLAVVALLCETLEYRLMVVFLGEDASFYDFPVLYRQLRLLFTWISYSAAYIPVALVFRRKQKKRIFAAVFCLALISAVAEGVCMMENIEWLYPDDPEIYGSPFYDATAFAACVARLYVVYCCLNSSARSRGLRRHEETTLYRKERRFDESSPVTVFTALIFMCLWMLAIAVFVEAFTMGFYEGIFMRDNALVCLIVAWIWTKAKIDEHRIKNYKKIVLPSNWPDDCAWDGYAQGLGEREFSTKDSRELTFYYHCQRCGISSLDGEYDYQKAMLIARNMKIKDPTEERVRKMFFAGEKMEAYNASVGDERESYRVNREKRIQELNWLGECMQFYGLHGREKRITMLKALRREAIREARLGPRAFELQKEAETYASQARATCDKLVQDQQMQEIFENLVIDNVCVRSACTGAVSVSADFMTKDSYRIFESVAPAIDGTVAARLYRDGVCVASAYFVFPVEGITKKIRRYAISTKPVDPCDHYDVRFEPVDIWAIERI